MPTVLTVGTFDLFHSGHVTLLEHCRINADRMPGSWLFAKERGCVIVGVNTDRFVSTFKKNPIYSLEDRMHVVSSCRYVDIVLENDSESLESMILDVNPNYLIVGSDWAPPRDYMKQIGTTESWLSEHGVKLIFVPRPEGSQSSTKIRESILNA